MFSSARAQDLWRWVCVLGVISKKTGYNAVQCSGFLAKFRKLRTCKLGGLLAATVTTPALSCMERDRWHSKREIKRVVTTAGEVSKVHSEENGELVAVLVQSDV